MASSGWHIANFILAFIALILVIILLFVIYDNKDKFSKSWTVQMGVIGEPPLEPLTEPTTSPDTMETGGKNMYIGNSNIKTDVVVQSNVNNVVGTHIAVNNQGSGSIVLIPGNDIKLSPSSIVVLPKEHIEMIMLSKGTFTLLHRSTAE